MKRNSVQEPSMMIARFILSLLALAAGPAGAQPLNPAQGVPSWERIKIGDYVQSLKFGGDLRLRSEHFDRRGAGLTHRNRFRYRLRFAADVTLPENLLLNLRLASGTGEQVSTNQSLDNLSSQKELWVDTIYLRWAPQLSDYGTVHLTGGRMTNPLWRIYTSDLLFDDDFNPEGLGEGVEWLLPGAGLSLFANAMQIVADEDSNSSRGQWLFSQQLGAETRMPLDSRLRLAAGYHKWSDENRSSFSAGAANEGNRRTATSTAGILHNRFGTGELTGQLSGWLGATPLAFQATVARNLRAINNTTTVKGMDARDGYQFGLIVGSAKAYRGWELAYFKKYSQTDVTVADVADSDFGDGGTNRRGHIFWLAYSPRDWLNLKVKHFVTDTIDRAFAPGDKAVNRTQWDLSVKF